MIDLKKVQTIVSIIMPVNAVNSYLFEAMKSVDSQIYPYIELIIISEKSIIKQIQYRISKTEVKYIDSGKMTDAGSRRNLGIRQASGKYIIFLDSDDYFYSVDSVSKLVDKIEQYEQENILGASCLIKDEDKQIFIYRDDLINKQVNQITSIQEYQNDSAFYRFIYKRDFLISKNCFFTNLQRFQDSLFMVEMMVKSGKFHLVPDIVYVYRKNHKTVQWDINKYRDHLTGVFKVMEISNSMSLNLLLKKMLKNIYITVQRRTPKNSEINDIKKQRELRKINFHFANLLWKEKDLIKKYPISYIRSLFCILKNGVCS